METIVGKYLKLIYSNLEDYQVAKIEVNKKEVTITGSFPTLEEGLMYSFTGDFINHKVYGKQFRVTNYDKAPDSTDGLVSYFASGKFKGIGPKKALALVNALKTDVINKIINNDDAFKNLKGFSLEQKKLIQEELKNSTSLDYLYIELAKYGLSNTMIKKLIANYGEDTLKIIKENPYILIYDLKGFGFIKADNIALSIGYKVDDLIRIKEATLYTLLNKCYEDGNTYVNEFKLEEAVLLLLKFDNSYLDKVKEALAKLSEEGRLIKIERKIFPLNLYKAEEGIARCLIELKDAKCKNYSLSKIGNELKNIEETFNIKYTDLQKDALSNVFKEKISIITGGPGTGKTTIVRGILALYSALTGIDMADEHYNVLLVAPTGKASKKLSESTFYKALTIHRALGYNYDGIFLYDEVNRLNVDLLIVDESSMIDIELAYRLLKALPLKTRVVFIGDENQLPSVGPGDFLHDIIASNLFKVFRLKEIMRQASDSNIIKLANKVLNQKIDFTLFNQKKEVYFYNIDINNYFNFLKRILDNYYISHNNTLDDLELLIPMYNGVVGINETNKFIQENYNHHKDKALNIGSNTYYIGDKIMQTVNSPEKEVMNGDTGVIIDINEDGALIDFNGKVTLMTKQEFKDLTLAYAISIHKSQGSEYKNVIMPIYSSFYIMLKKKLIYTGITRAKEKLIIIGDYKVLENSIKYVEEPRLTNLVNILAMHGNSSSGKKIITDTKSAFNVLAEELNGLTPYDFLDKNVHIPQD